MKKDFLDIIWNISLLIYNNRTYTNYFQRYFLLGCKSLKSLTLPPFIFTTWPPDSLLFRTKHMIWLNTTSPPPLRLFWVLVITYQVFGQVQVDSLV